jgi:hypothetical protein
VVIDLLMDVTDLARVRSPMDELVHSVAVLAGRPGAEMHRTWVAATRPRLVDLDFSVLSALAGTRGFLPDFLMPPPTTSRTTFACELERVRAATPEQVRRDLDRVVLPDVLRPLRDNPERELGKLADQLRAALATDRDDSAVAESGEIMTGDIVEWSREHRRA